VPALDLAELVNRKVADELERMNGRLEELIAEAVDRELGRLVAQELADRANAIATKTLGGNAGPSPGKQCRRCGEVKTPADFQPGRAVCRSCRNREAVEGQRRRALERSDPLATAGPTSTTSPLDSPAT
jgi:hypothetical protein